MSAEYNELITRTFCENSIRSVMMIDDHFLPYSDYIKSLENPQGIEQAIIDGTKRATKLMSFFHQRSFICDVDNGSEHLNPEKVRKSDLLVLDYHLEENSPSKSLKILENLRDTNHMNMVVIYTSEKLDRVWLEVACSLRGKHEPELNDFQERLWDDLEDDVLTELKEHLSEYSELSNFIIKGSLSEKLLNRIKESPTIPRNIHPLQQYIAEQVLNESHNKLDSPYNSHSMRGEYNEAKWICIGNLFIALCNKTDQEDDSQLIWDTLESSLHHWRPNFYRLLSSEIQNIIEDGNFSMKGYLEREHESQAAWLWRLKNSINEENLLDLYKGMNELLWDEIKDNNNLIQFSRKVIEHSYKATAVQPTIDIKIDPAAWAKFDTEVLLECVNHIYDNKQVAQAQPRNIIHALNENMSSKAFTGKCVTVGTIIYETTNLRYYLCVTPSCETVQKQYSDAMSNSMKPHRLMKFIQLNPCKIDIALSHATHSKYIFIKNEDKRIALSVLDNITDLPAIFFGIVKNHDEVNLTSGDPLNINFINETNDTNFKPVRQLKDAYAARFQALASHHAGRIGVDYIQYSTPAAISSATPVSGNLNLAGHINNPEDVLVEGSLILESGQKYRGEINITSNLTIDDGDTGKIPINITGALAVESNENNSSNLLINSTLTVSSRDE